MNTSTHSKQRLLLALCRISDPAIMNAALEAILTHKEFKEIENRVRIFEMLANQTPQRDIAEALGVGIATVTRGAHAFREGQFALLAEYLNRVPEGKN
jgi:Trp operon repressor